MSKDKSLPEIYHEIVSRAIDEKGVYPHQMLTMDADGKMGVYALMLQHPQEVYGAIKKALADKPKELIYSMDRYTKSGQGTELNDVLAGAHWNGQFWRPFVIEYQDEPRIVKPLNWDNNWWKAAITCELGQFLGEVVVYDSQSDPRRN